LRHFGEGREAVAAILEAHVSLAQVYYRMKRKADGDRERGVVQELKTQQDANQSGGKAQ